MIFPALVFFLLLVCALWLLRQKSSFFDGEQTSALEILKKRYAQGDISRDEFEQMKKDIS